MSLEHVLGCEPSVSSPVTPTWRGSRSSDLGRRTWTLEADEKMLQDAFLNLFLNAAQATGGQGRHPRRGRRVGPGDGPRRRRGRWPGNRPLHVLERLFEPFFTTRHRGTGLGLPIVRRDVEAHGGEVNVSAAEGGGTRVTVSLPLQQHEPS